MSSAIGTQNFYKSIPNASLFKVISEPKLSEKRRLNLYLNTSRMPSYGKWKHDPWQIEDIRFVIDDNNEEIFLLRNRGGSKTRDGVELSIWFGYQRSKNGDLNRVLWFSASESQLEQVREYFMQSRYVNRNKSSSDRIILWNGNVIKLRMMSEKQAVSPRSDIIFFDEEQSMKKSIYLQALGTMVGSALNKKIHLGTTELDTIFEENFLRLSPLGLVREHHVDECSWTTVEKELRNYDGQPEFVIQSQLFCKWVRAQGLVFEDVEVRELTEVEKLLIKPGVYYGVDPNPKEGHAAIKLQFIEGKKIYVSGEFSSLDKDLLAKYPGDDDSVAFSKELAGLLIWDAICEIEENAGEEFLKTFNRTIPKSSINGDLYIKRWNEENKHKRIYAIRKYKIIIDPKCVNAIKHIKGAAWDPKQPKAKLLKTSTQHYLDGFIHAAQITRPFAIKVY